MHVPEWLVTPFDMKIDNKDYESDIEDEPLKCKWSSKQERCSKAKTLQNIEAISTLLLSTPNSQQQPNHSYLHTKLIHG